MKGQQEGMGVISICRSREAPIEPKLYYPAYELSYAAMLLNILTSVNASAEASKASAVRLESFPKQ